MFLTSIFMIKKPNKKLNQNSKIILTNPNLKNILIIIESSLVGVITDIIGAGGGFLIVPA